MALWRKFHVHVYRTTQVHEVDVEADTPQEAMTKALEQAKQPGSLWRPAERDFLAVPFPEAE